MSAEAPILEPPPPPRTPARRRWLLRVLLGIAVLVVLVGIAATWLLTTSGGARLVLSQVAGIAGGGIRYEGVQGSLGGPLRIKLLVVDRPDLYVRIDDLELDSSPWAPLFGRLVVHRLHAGRVEVRTASSEAAAKVPVEFAPPYPVVLESGKVGELRLGALSQAGAKPAGTDVVVRDIFLRGEGDERRWKLDEARAVTEQGKAALSGTILTRAPYTIDMKAVGEGVAAQRPWRADVAATGTLLAIDARLDAQVSGQPATGRLKLEPFAPQPVRSVELLARDVDVSRHVEGPHTKLSVDVRLAASSNAFAGPVRVTNAEPGPWDKQRIPVASMAARVVVTKERVDLRDMELLLAGGGSATGSATLTRDQAEADLRVADVDLAALDGRLQKTKVTGTISAHGDREAQRFELALKEPRFEVLGRAALAGERLTVDTATVRTGGGSVSGKGELALTGKREFRFQGEAKHFDPSAFVRSGKGDLNFAFTTSGTLEPTPAGQARLEIAPSTIAGLPASGRVDVAGDSRRITRLDMDVTVGESRLTARGSLGNAGDAMDVTFNASNLAAIGKPFGVAVAGKLSGEGRVTGTFAAPAGRVALTGADLALPSNVFVRSLTARIEAGTDPSSPIDGRVEAKGIALGEGRPPQSFAEEATAVLKGTRAAHRLEVSATMRRDSVLKATFQGGLDPKSRAPAWSGRVQSLSLSGRGAFALTAPATLTASAERVELGDASLKGDWGSARFMVTRWTPTTLEVKGTSPGILVQNLARSLRITTVPRSSLVLAADWDVRGAQELDANVRLRRVSGDLRVGEPATPLGLEVMQARLDVARGRAKATLEITGQRVGRIAGEGTGLIARGDGGWRLVPSAPVNAKVTAEHTNLEALSPWLGADARLGGQLNANVVVEGTSADPRISGGARATNLVLREPTSGFELEQGTIALRLAGKSLAIEQLSAVTPWRPSPAARERMRRAQPVTAGRITADGAIDLGERTGAIRVKLAQVPVTQVETRFVALSGEVRLGAGAKELLVSGALKVDAGWIGALASAPPSVSEDVVIVRATTPAEEAPPSEPIRLDLKLSAGDSLYFQGRGLDTRLAGEVHLTGPPGAGMRATGSIRTVGGTYDGYGQSLAIERGVLTFQGALDNPRLNVLALRKGLPVEAGVEVLGSMSRPRVRLVSVPDVPEPEKLSWLVLGRGAADASLGDSALMVAAARALLGGSLPGTDLTKKLGFDEIKIGRADTGVLGVLPQSTVAGRTGSAAASEVVTVGRRVGPGLYLTYEQGLADAEGALKFAWRVTRQFQVLARAGYLPGLDAVYRWTFK